MGLSIYSTSSPVTMLSRSVLGSGFDRRRLERAGQVWAIEVDAFLAEQCVAAPSVPIPSCT